MKRLLQAHCLALEEEEMENQPRLFMRSYRSNETAEPQPQSPIKDSQPGEVHHQLTYLQPTISLFHLFLVQKKRNQNSYATEVSLQWNQRKPRMDLFYLTKASRPIH